MKMKKKKTISNYNRKGQLALFSMQLPGIIYALIFLYIPMIGIIIAFKDYKFNLGMFGSPWNGLKNFEFLFKSNTFFTLLRNTIGYNVVFILLSRLLCVACALLLYNIANKYAIKFIQSGIFIPYLLSWIVVSYASYAFLANDLGLINSVIRFFGGENISFYNSPKYWPFILTFFYLWKTIGFDTLVYYGTILSIDTEQLEAADLDGCSYMQKVRYIILPHLKQVIVMLLILALGGIIRSDFGMFYYLPKDTGALYSVTDTLDTYINRAILVNGSMGSASAAGLIQSVVGMILVIVTNKVVKKMDSDSALF